MQCFSGATSGGTVFENAQAARSLADRLGVPKYAHVLVPMEQGYVAASSSSRKHRIDGPSSTAPPAKCAKSVEKVYDLYDSFYEDSDSEREDRIALNAVNDSLRTEIASGSAMDVDSEIADAAGFSDNVEYDSVSIGSEESDDDRQVPYLSLSSNTDTNLQCAALLAASKRSSLDIVSRMKFAQYIGDHFATCANCKGKKATGSSQEWIVNSGASSHFTYDLEDLPNMNP
ncbi:hypothetical protein AAF712_015150 [Marasmius tenuissimus]|uniref:Uncharacterized protein n=1 Tax=Marasmius tenuissimus TaxID=585030 RepID=A0ABR2ZBB3_9AGAR